MHHKSLALHSLKYVGMKDWFAAKNISVRCWTYAIVLHQSRQWVIFCDPWPTWPINQLTLTRVDPWPCPRPWHESITTTYEPWWIHDYCLLFSAVWNSGSLVYVVYTACHGEQFFYHGSSVLRYWLVRDPGDPFTFVDPFLTHGPWPVDPLSALRDIHFSNKAV